MRMGSQSAGSAVEPPDVWGSDGGAREAGHAHRDGEEGGGEPRDRHGLRRAAGGGGWYGEQRGTIARAEAAADAAPPNPSVHAPSAPPTVTENEVVRAGNKTGKVSGQRARVASKASASATSSVESVR
jgi:hypothetical protein